MENFVEKLQLANPDLRFVKGERFKWSPADQTITYCLREPADTWSLLHELGHALLEHGNFSSDLNLLQKEIAAWDKARELAPVYNVKISDDYIEDCLDTYRDWLHKRSACPRCAMLGVQKAQNRYVCLSCNHTWLVNQKQSCRPYRRSETKIEP